MRKVYDTETIDRRGSTAQKLFSTAMAFFLVFGATSALAQTDFNGSLKNVSITDAAGTNTPPTANFVYTKDGDNFTFDASSSSDSDGSVTKYQWDFGDGTSIAGTTVNHQFPIENSHLVTLTVSDNNGGVTISQINIAESGTILAEQVSDYSYTTSTSLYGSDILITGQSFQVTQNGTTNSIALYTNSASQANITVKIGTTSDLSSSYLGKGTLAYDGSTPGEITIDLETGVRLTTGTTYFLAVYADGNYANRISLLGSASSSYASGAYQASRGWPMINGGGRLDLYFKVVE